MTEKKKVNPLEGMKTVDEIKKMFEHIEPLKDDIVIVPKVVSKYTKGGIEIFDDQRDKMAEKVVMQGAIVIKAGNACVTIKEGDIINKNPQLPQKYIEIDKKSGYRAIVISEHAASVRLHPKGGWGDTMVVYDPSDLIELPVQPENN